MDFKEPNFTEQQNQDFDSFLKELNGKPTDLVVILQKAQEIFGYLPPCVQTKIAESLQIPIETVYSVSTFYTQFSLQPKGKNIVKICLGTACFVKGSSEVLGALLEHLGVKEKEVTADGCFSVEGTKCLGICGSAPAVMVNSDIHAKFQAKNIKKTLDEYAVLEEVV